MGELYLYRDGEPEFALPFLPPNSTIWSHMMGSSVEFKFLLLRFEQRALKHFLININVLLHFGQIAIESCAAGIHFLYQRSPDREFSKEALIFTHFCREDGAIDIDEISSKNSA